MGWMGASGTGGRAFRDQPGQKEGVEAPIYLPRAPGGGDKAFEGGPMRVFTPLEVCESALARRARLR